MLSRDKYNTERNNPLTFKGYGLAYTSRNADEKPLTACQH